MDVQEIRQNILRVLYDAYHQGDGRGEVEYGELADGLGLTQRQLQSCLGYLLDKNYVQSITVSVVPPVTLTYLQITSAGIDLYEGHTHDATVVSVPALSSVPLERHGRGFTETKQEDSVKAEAQVFLSYAREDEEKVKKLYQRLSDAGFKPWMDTKDLLPGEEWKSSIQKAIRRSDFFLACLSANSVNKRGFLQKEIRNALDVWQEMLDSDIYLIPVRLEDCEVPEKLRDFQWVNLFEDNGWTQLVKAIQVGMERRQK